MANHLPRPKQLAILQALTEGCSVRSTERMVGVSRETVLSLLVRVGRGCAVLLDKMMRNLTCERLELDEIWSYVHTKQRHLHDASDATHGDRWVFVAIDADTKLIPCFRVGDRDAATTRAFVEDLAGRLTNRVQISADGFGPYVNAIEDAFGADVDFGTVLKEYEAEPLGPGRYSPPHVTKVTKTVVTGDPNVALISTSYVERQNLTIRMRTRRFTRLTNAFSKKLENHGAAVALHMAAYNLVTVHQTLRVTPAMAANVTQNVWSMEELLDRALEARTA